ncbi:MAG: transposase [Clostridia bacterium]|nr:transposase [Clostridia bacterium]
MTRESAKSREQIQLVSLEDLIPYESVYDEYYDCYICPNNQVLPYYTTNREGYREYRSDPKICAHCPHLAQCTNSKAHIKTVARHVWAEYEEATEENRYTYGIKEYYPMREETIERSFGLAKELHSFRYTQEYGKARMEVKAALTFACMNLKSWRKSGGKQAGINLFHHILASFFASFHILMQQTRSQPEAASGFVDGLKQVGLLGQQDHVKIDVARNTVHRAL